MALEAEDLTKNNVDAGNRGDWISLRLRHQLNTIFFLAKTADSTTPLGRWQLPTVHNNSTKLKDLPTVISVLKDKKESVVETGDGVS